ncbi:uncharacterized protein BDZ99DRAFT_517932 [Mytilinidion resinicola]|uniref:Uncharacterized protein n=1 Tax=Mytilinidion resinicola TaxID=574789 RepID=A0A6A6YUK1_9PEZI|nr:uncharacterized protein BDZ99DRAFT_517932 [Mytilinidion resinicola]KAF2812063.1 hypothetical protein BDZ99DRAFT_517932 [Mytilinidion resinicola]
MTFPSSSKNVSSHIPPSLAMVPNDLPDFASRFPCADYKSHPRNLQHKNCSGRLDSWDVLTDMPSPSQNKRKSTASPRECATFPSLTSPRARAPTPEPTKRLRSPSYESSNSLEDAPIPSLIPRRATPSVPEPTKRFRTRSPVRYEERAYSREYSPSSLACSCFPLTSSRVGIDIPVPTQRSRPVRYEERPSSPEYPPFSPISPSPAPHDERAYSLEYPPFSPMSSPSPVPREELAYPWGIPDIVPSIETSTLHSQNFEPRGAGVRTSPIQGGSAWSSIEISDTERSSHTLEGDIVPSREEASYSPFDTRAPHDGAAHTLAPRVRTSTAERVGGEEVRDSEGLAYTPAKRQVEEDDAVEAGGVGDAAASERGAFPAFVDATSREKEMRKPIEESDGRLALLQALMENERKVRAKAWEMYEDVMGEGVR